MRAITSTLDRLLLSGLGGLLLGLAVGGCEDQRNDAKNAVSAAKAIMDIAKDTAEASKAAEQASAEAEAEARAQIPEGADPKQAEEQVQLAKGIAAMKAMQDAHAGGPVVNWRQLAVFLPDELGGFKANGKLKGATQSAGGMKVTNVDRSYSAGEQSVKIEITDAAYAPMLRAPFAMAAMIEEDSSEGYRKGTRIGGEPAIVEWKESSKRSTASVLVGKRFMVHVRANGAASDTTAKDISGALDLAKLATLKGEDEEAAKKREDEEAAKPAKPE
jgi:hypothetical protein